MADAVFDFDIRDQASAKIRKIKGAADDAGTSIQRTANVLRAGGGLAEGGVLGKVAGRMGSLAPLLTSGSMALGAFGIAAMGAGLGFQAFSNIVNSSMAIFEEAIALQKQFTDAVRQGGEARKNLAAGAVGQAPSLKKLLLAGGSLAMVKDAQSRGISYEDAIAGETALALMPAKDRKRYRDDAMNIAATGVMGYGDAAGKLRGSRGNIQGVMQNALGLRNTSDAREKVARMLMGARSAEGYQIPGIENINQAVAASGVVGREQAGLLTSGATTTAINAANQATLDPVHALKKKVNQAVTDHISSLQKLAGAENELMAFLKDFGWLFTGSRSARGKLEDYSASVSLSRGE